MDECKPLAGGRRREGRRGRRRGATGRRRVRPRARPVPGQSGAQGSAVQVNPMEAQLKGPGAKCFKE